MTVSEESQKRVRRSKKCNIWMLIVSIVLLIVLCALLMARIHGLNAKIDKMTAQVEGLSKVAAEQRAVLDLLREELETAKAQEGAGKGEDMSGNGISGEKEPGQENIQQGNPLPGVTDAPDDGQKENPGDDPGEAVEVSSPEVTAAHKVYLTFDDGPSSNTQDILDILEKYDIKATFFVVGKEGNTAKESLQRIVDDGHTLGMHSWSHKYSELYASIDSFAEDFKKQQDYLYEVTGVKSMVYRFPGGSSNTISDINMAEFAKYLEGEGVRFFDWNISSGDGGSVLLPVETLLKNCTGTISRYSTSVILMHDSPQKSTTLEALPSIIEKIQAMDDTVILPITDDTVLIQHIKWQDEEGGTQTENEE